MDGQGTKQGAGQGAGQDRAASVLNTAAAGSQRRKAGIPTSSKPATVVEVSDDDYRSFCWPCHALDERNNEGKKK